MVPLTYESTGSSQNRGKTESHRQKGKSERTNKMKKLMITAAAAMTAMVGFCTIESSNVVGYSTIDLREGFKAQGACFIPVSDTTIDLTDVVVTGYDKEEGTDSDVYIQSLDAAGKQIEGSVYFWLDIVDGEDVYYGWMNEAGDFIEKGDAVFAPGDGVWVYAPSTEFKLQYSGQVSQSATAVALRKGFRLVSNPNPIGIDLTSISVEGYDKEEGTDSDVYIQSLDAAGKQVEGSVYFWLDIVDGEDVYYGWMNEGGDFIEEGDKILEMGETIWAYAPDTWSVVIPGVSL